MHIKRFEAPSLNEALARVKEELGPDALILSSRTLRRGRDRFGLLSKSVVEVQAAKERTGEEVLTPDWSRRYGLESQVDLERPPARSRTDARSSNFEEEMREELRALRLAMTDLQSGSKLALPSAPASLVLDEDDDCPQLREAGIEESVRRRLSAQWRDRREVEASLRLGDVFREGVESACAPLRPRVGGVRIVVGAPGVGKTTTLAKLAARNEEGERDIALVSLDQYRIGGADSLRRYAELMESPFSIAGDANEIRDLSRRMPGHEILVDTAGRGADRDAPEIEIESLRSALGEDLSVELVVDASSRLEVQRAHLARFAHLRPDRMIVTKTDENPEFSSLINLLLDPQAPPIGWTGTGQRVPEDLDPIDPARLVRHVLGVAA